MMSGREPHSFGLTHTDISYSMAANMTGSDVPELLSGCVHTATLAVCTVLVAFVICMGCTGNGLALFSALTTKRLRSNSELFVINLAGADFILCTCLSPIFLFLLFSASPAPAVFCGSILFLATTAGSLSLLSLAAIAVHRQLRVSGRMRRPVTLTQAATTVAVIWIISISVALGGMVHSITSRGQRPENKCQIVLTNGELATNQFVVYLLAPVAVVSIGTIAACYGCIARNVRRLRMYDAVTPHADNGHHLAEMAIEKCGNGYQQNSSLVANKCLPSGDHCADDNGGRAGTMCLVVTLIIVLCWTPLIIAEFIELATGASIFIFQVKICGIALVFLNSALNPYMYGQTSGSMKDRYADLLCKFACCHISAQRTIKLRNSDVRTLEGCPLRSSHVTSDTNTAHAYAPEPTVKDGRHGLCYVNRCHNNYAHNILLCHNYNTSPRHKGDDFSAV